MKPKDSKITFFHQLESSDCGASCLKMIASYYGKTVSIRKLRDLCRVTKNGSTLKDLIYAASDIGFDTLPANLTIREIENEDIPKPCILHWKESHYVVFSGKKKDKYCIIDPGFGQMAFTEEDLKRFWQKDKEKGVVLLLEPREDFNCANLSTDQEERSTFRFLVSRAARFKNKLIWIVLLMIALACINATFPFFNKLLVDKGVVGRDFLFILYLLSAQLVLSAGYNGLTLFQEWIFLKTRYSFSLELISDLLTKVAKMPITFFENRLATDVILRINDNKRIEEFLSTHSLQFLVSVILFVVYSVILFFYSTAILLFFIFFSFLSVTWILIYQNKRKYIDYKRFEADTINNNILYEIVNGIFDLKVGNSTGYKIEEWKSTQTDLHELSKRSMLLEIKQSVGSNYLLQFKNVLITAYAAYLVLHNKLSIGDLLGISFMLGQLAVPIENFVIFIYAYQDALISANRMIDIYDSEDEIQTQKMQKIDEPDSTDDELIRFRDVAFSYNRQSTVFSELSLTFKLHSTNAIVGLSGSGKTTLIKLLLKYYPVESGCISVNGISLDNFPISSWREKIGVVFQDGYIFSDSIERNIVMDKNIDQERLAEVLVLSNCIEFIDKFPKKLNTKIGNSGVSLSGGQKQRLLIARALYRNPEILILDEATSSLDAKNEKLIHENLLRYNKNRTVIIIAHRLSTVVAADKIVVLKDGHCIEEGTHKELLDKRGNYFNLISNQLSMA